MLRTKPSLTSLDHYFFGIFSKKRQPFFTSCWSLAHPHYLIFVCDFDGRNKEINQINFNLIMKGIVKSKKKNESHLVVFIRERRKDCSPPSLHSWSINQIFRARTYMEGKWKYLEPYLSTISFSLVWSEMLKLYGLWYIRSIWIRCYGTLVSGCFLLFLVSSLETTNYYRYYLTGIWYKAKTYYAHLYIEFPLLFAPY